MFLKKAFMKHNADKVVFAIFVIYLSILCYDISHRTALWDEFQNSALPYILYDMTHEMSSSGLMNFSEIKAFAINYHAHYPVFYSLIHHPPFHRIFLYASFMLFGPGEFAGRIVSVVFLAAALIITYMLALELTGKKRVALLSASVLALIPTFVEYGRLIMLEVPLTAMTALVIYAFVRYKKKENIKNAAFIGVAAGLCILTKNYGVLVIIPLAAHTVIENGFSSLLDRKLMLSGLIAFLVAAPWYIFAFELPVMVGVEKNLLGAYVNYFTFSTDVLYVFPEFYLLTFSWILGGLSVAALARAFMRRDGIDKLMLMWIVVYLVIFTLFINPSTGSLHRFIIPVLPAFSILCARILNEFIESKRLMGHGITAVILILCASAAFTWIHNAPPAGSNSIEDAVVYSMSNSPEGSTIITTNFNQIFYFMKHDRNLSFFTLNAMRMDHLQDAMNSTYATEARMAVGIRNAGNYSYLILEYPLHEEIEKDGRFMPFIYNGGCFEAEAEFNGQKNVTVYRTIGDCA